MARSRLAKLCRNAGFVWVLLLLFALPANAAFLTFVQVVKDGEGAVDGLYRPQSVTLSPDIFRLAASMDWPSLSAAPNWES